MVSTQSHLNLVYTFTSFCLKINVSMIHIFVRFPDQNFVYYSAFIVHTTLNLMTLIVLVYKLNV